jgi:hypothetical protein
MRRPTLRSSILMTLFVVLCTVTFSYAEPQRKLDVPLAWTPKEAPALPVVDLTGGVRRLQVKAFTDVRNERGLIGENPEKKPPVSVRTSSDVAAYVTGAVSRELSQLGLEISEQDPERVLTGEITQFWVKDTGSYDATVRVKLTVRGADGMEVWTGLASGRGENWGRQLKPINYTETLTSALLDLVANIVRTPEFMKSIRKSS